MTKKSRQGTPKEKGIPPQWGFLYYLDEITKPLLVPSQIEIFHFVQLFQDFRLYSENSVTIVITIYFWWWKDWNPICNLKNFLQKPFLLQKLRTWGGAGSPPTSGWFSLLIFLKAAKPRLWGLKPPPVNRSWFLGEQIKEKVERWRCMARDTFWV